LQEKRASPADVNVDDHSFRRMRNKEKFYFPITPKMLSANSTRSKIKTKISEICQTGVCLFELPSILAADGGFSFLQLSKLIKHTKKPPDNRRKQLLRLVDTFQRHPPAIGRKAVGLISLPSPPRREEAL